jgi:hypothetical protein
MAPQRGANTICCNHQVRVICFAGQGFKARGLARFKSGYPAAVDNPDIVVARHCLRQRINQIRAVCHTIGAAEFSGKPASQFKFRQLASADGIADANSFRRATLCFKFLPHTQVLKDPNGIWAQLKACANRFQSGGLLKDCC